MMKALLLGLAVAASSALAQVNGTFKPAGDMIAGRTNSQNVLLQDGRVFIVGGGATTATELYDPATGAFTFAGDLPSPAIVLTATLLSDGRVLIIGSDSVTPHGVWSPTRGVLYDASNGTFKAAGEMLAQGGDTASLLHDGRVLITGAVCCDDGVRVEANPQIFDPATNAFSLTGRFQSPGDGVFIEGAPNISAAVSLADGRVLFAGEPASEIYDPATGTFSLTGSMVTPCILGGTPQYIAGRTATLLANGKVLLVGGEHEDCGLFSEAEIYDPDRGTFQLTGSTSTPRNIGHTATLLSDGNVLIAGGEGFGYSAYATAEIYDPVTGSFAPAGNMTVGRFEHAATRLTNGTVLITGSFGYERSAEIYVPLIHARHRSVK